MAEQDCRSLRQLAGDWLSGSALSANTVQAYQTALIDLVEHFERVGLQPADIKYKHAVAWMVSLQKRNYAGITINCYLSAARGLWRELLLLDIAHHNPFRELRNAPYQRPLPEPLAPSEIRALIKAEPDLQLHTLWEFFYATGFRIDVTRRIKRDQLDFANKCIKVRNKRKKEQIQPLRDPILLLLKAHLERSPDSPWLFPGKDWNGSKPMTSDTIRKNLREAAKRIGLTRDVRPHQLRHSIATHMFDGGADLRDVQEFLDHDSVQTTQIYTRVSRKRLRDVIERTHPRENDA